MTLQEIREKKFPRAFKGYADAEVDQFMVQVAAAFEKLEEETRLGREQSEGLKTRLAEYEGMDREMRGALLAAQRAAREIVEEARNKEKALLEETKASLVQIEEEVQKLSEQSEFLKRQAQQEIDEMKARALEEIEARKNRANEEYEAQTKALQADHAREKEALELEIAQLASARATVRNEIETLLKENISVLSGRLQSFYEPEPSEPEAAEETQNADAPAQETGLETETQPAATDEFKQEPRVGFAPYSPADIPGADAPDGLPKLDFQG